MTRGQLGPHFPATSTSVPSGRGLQRSPYSYCCYSFMITHNLLRKARVRPGGGKPASALRRPPWISQLPVKFVWTSGRANKDKAWVFLEAIG